MEKFELEDHDFIELNKLLKILSWVASGGEAKQLIDAGLVKVNDETETRRRRKLRTGDVVQLEDQTAKIE